jgi:hypothetical protein
MRKFLVPLAFLAALAAPRLAPAHEREKEHENKHGRPHHEAQTLLFFGTMYGVDGPFLGDANRIRGVEGDEAPWVIAKFIRGRLGTDGDLRIRVRGLVFKDDPSVPPELRGKNDEEQFRGLVSCLTEQGDQVVEANVVTQGFKATPDGDSNIDAKLALPNPCVAPIVFVLAGSEDKWFAVTGVETEQEDE